MLITYRASCAAEQPLHSAAVSGCGRRGGAKGVAPGVQPAPVVGPVQLLACNTPERVAESEHLQGCGHNIPSIHRGMPTNAAGAPGQ